jgi:hypothetical protein
MSANVKLDDAINENSTDIAQDVNESTLITKENLIGIWHTSPYFQYIMGDKYYFFEDGKFEFHFSQNSVNNFRLVLGEWFLDENKLQLVVNEKIKTIGGDPQISQPLWLESNQVESVVGGIDEVITIEESEKTEYRIEKVVGNNEFNEISIIVDETRYWRLCNDPYVDGESYRKAESDKNDTKDITMKFYKMLQDSDGNLMTYSIERVDCATICENIIDLINQKNGIQINKMWIENNKAYIDLNMKEGMEFSRGSAANAIRLSELLMTLFSYPEIKEVEILLDGQSGVVGDHFMFNKVFTLDNVIRLQE